MDVRYVAYTGKASNVLKNKGCPGATTIHKLIYHSIMLPNGKYKYTQRASLEGYPSVIVVDEVSMVPKKMWDILCSYNAYIIACGDPEQLPPVCDNKDEDPNNHLLDHPHIFLDEIMRQAQESEIIRLSMHVRQGNPISTFEAKGEEVKIVNNEEVSSSMLLWSDQVLCATNINCNKLNYQMRNAIGLTGDPQIGDKIINRHNEWDIASSTGNPLTNGVIGKVCDYIKSDKMIYPGSVRSQRSDFEVPVYLCNIADEDSGIFSGIIMDYNLFNGKDKSLSGREEYIITRRLKQFIPLVFTYGYAITVWKAQGSEWDKVVLFEEGWPRNREEHRKYLYTGITRAAEKLVVVIK